MRLKRNNRQRKTFNTGFFKLLRSNKLVLLRSNKLVLLTVILLITLLILIISSNILTIKTMEVVLNRVNCATELQIKDQANFLGQNFFLVGRDAVEETLKERFICIKKINLSKFFPNKVKLDIVGRDAQASLIKREASESASVENIGTPSAQISKGFYLLDNEGVIFSQTSDQSSVPKIFLNDPDLSLGQGADNLIVSLAILEKLKTLGLNVQTTQIVDKFFIIFPNGGPKIVFRLDDNVDTQVASLQLILSKAKIDLVELEFIDLRFDKPIVRFAPKKQ